MRVQLYHEGLGQKFELAIVEFPEKTSLCAISPQEFINKVWEHLTPVERTFISKQFSYSAGYSLETYGTRGVYRITCGSNTLISAYEFHEGVDNHWVSCNDTAHKSISVEGENNDCH